LYTPSSDLDSSGAYAVFVSGNDVYVAGYTNTSHGSRNYTSEDHGVATLWKNGKAQRLSNNDSRARSIYVSGADVYVAGYEKNARGKNVAVLWKNGVAQRLSDGYYDAEARSIFVK
jgi:hypothetical protein